MKKIIILSISIIWFTNIANSQTYTSSLSIENVDITELKVGDDVIVPVKLVEKSGGLVAGFQLYIDFNHDLLTWKGTTENPLTGIQKFHSKLKYSPGDWIFNDNSNQLAAIWIDPALSGVSLENGDLLIEIVFKYNGGLEPGEKSMLVWGDTFELKDGVVVKGPTEMTSELIDVFILENINGSIFISK